MPDSDSYAVIKTGGKQLSVKPGQKVTVEKVPGKKGDEVIFSEVLTYRPQGGSMKIGTPLIKGAQVRAKILAEVKDEKILIYKKKRRTGYTKRQGHRQTKTEVLIEEILGV